MIFLPKNNFQRQVKFEGTPGIIDKVICKETLNVNREIWFYDIERS